jgi:hypothetical protein
MTPENLQTLANLITTIEQFTPSAGGTLQVIRGPDQGLVALTGDRTALIRLSLAILRCALKTRSKDASAKTQVTAIADLFAAPSPVRDLFIQLDETQLEQKQTRKRHSTTKLLARFLFRRS